MSRKFKIYGKIKRPEIKPVQFQETWKDYQYKDIKRSTGKGEDDFEIETKEEIIETNIEEHIASFKDECGIRAIMKKLALTGDVSLLDETGQPVYMDLSKIPDDPQGKLAAYKSAQQAFEKIDPELRGSMSMEDFIKNMDEAKLTAYFDKKFAESKAKAEREASK